MDELGDIFGFLKPGDNSKGLVRNLDLALSVGGSGGAAGNGGAIQIINTGEILTRGAQADGTAAGGRTGDIGYEIVSIPWLGRFLVFVDVCYKKIAGDRVASAYVRPLLLSC